MNFRSVTKLVVAVVLAASLTACEDSTERAERHFQSGLALLEEGDVERALIEFRNVFNLNGSHRAARQAYARIVRDQGKMREAYGQYLRLIEQYPDDLEGRIALAQMAFDRQDWAEFDRHAQAAIELAPEDPTVRVLAVAADYRAAIEAEDDPARQAVFDRVLALSEEVPDSTILRNLEIHGYIQNLAYSSALEAIDRALEQDPDNRSYYNTRLGLLAELKDDAALEAELRDMVTRFPEDDAIKQTLIRFYLSRDEPERAEDFLREISDPEAEDPGFYLALLQFIGERQGPEALMAELDRVIPQVADPTVYQGMRAGLVFQQGDRDQGIADMEALLDGRTDSEQVRRLKVSLAQMLLQTGNDVGARRLIEEVLTADPGQVDALRMSAGWQIQADDTDGAIATLRAALDQEPQDVRSMTLMSEAYLRAGNRDLARDFLSLAVDASGSAPTEAIRYARFLAQEDRLAPAEQALVASLRTNRNDPGVLTELGRVYLMMDDLPRLRQVIASLEGLDDPAAGRAADALQTALIERESGAGAAIAFLESALADWDDELAATGALVRARLAGGDVEAALSLAESAVAENPQDPARRRMLAIVRAAAGQLDEAEAIYRDLLEERPETPRLWIELIRLVGAQPDRAADAEDLVTQGLAANPESGDLLWAQAGNLERKGDIDGAIAIYEDLYAQNSGSAIIANNLASLLASYRDDPDSLQRADIIARRLRGSDQPAFQDTWGWIAFRRGRAEEALEPLEAAAGRLQRDPLVQYHLGRVYEELQRPEDAVARYERAVILAGEADTDTPPIADARARLEALQSGPQPAQD